MRASSELRTIAREHRLSPESLAWPLFVTDAPRSEPAPGFCDSNVKRLSLEDLPAAVDEAVALELGALLIFPVTPADRKDAQGSEAYRYGNIVSRALDIIKSRPKAPPVVCDVALDPYTLSGHDGVLTEDGRHVDNDLTLHRLGEQARFLAKNGADILAPSDMMDGRIGYIRATLDAEHAEDLPILSYAVKYASACYGPFRGAVGSIKPGKGVDKRTYQMDPANIREAIMEARLDIAEGTDMLMVKPAGPYLDVIRAVREETLLPLWAYQVSGEYAMFRAAEIVGSGHFFALLMEHILACKRAGADMIVTYGAPQIARAL